ncbi:putative metal ion efflux outer membrane protein [Desulfosarcina variabilis str. Montpellier]|uniref:TolC family protein n=1 Tax=Desulfosarcina variabilis TaxID=2300 RepID=UPI003AFAE639
MKTLVLLVAGILAVWFSGMAGTAVGGYRDLKQDIEAYSPPALLHVSAAPQSPDTVTADAFDGETQSINAMRDRWAEALRCRIQPAHAGELAVVARDDANTLSILKHQFSLEATRQLILLRNPSIKAAATRVKAALEGFGQVEQLDAILRQYSAFTEGVMAGVGPMRGGADTIQMKFPFPGVTALKGQIAEKNVEDRVHQLDRVRRDVVAQGSKAYWNLLYTHQALAITRDTLDRLSHLESVATTRYGAGKASYQDVVKIRIGREKLIEQLTTLEKQRVNLETELLTLMDMEPGPSLGWPQSTVPDTRIPSLEDLYPLALANRQELSRMRTLIARMQRMIEMAETMIQPALSRNTALFTDEAAVQVGSGGMKPSFATNLSPTRGKGLPQNAWFGSRDAYLRETRRKLVALKADLAEAEARTRLMVRTGWFDLDKARRERSLFNNRLLELARTSLDVSTRGYESGKVSFADVIASYTGWLDVNLAGQRRNSDVGIARLELECRVGTPLLKKPADARSGVARGSQ